MTDQKENLNKLQEELQKFSGEVSEKTRELWLAGLGALSVAEKEGSKLFNDFLDRGKELVDRGEKLEKQGTDFAKEQSEHLSVYFKDAVDFFEGKMKSVKDSLGGNSSEEVKNLSDMVDQLSAKVAELTKKLDKKDSKK